MAQYITNDYWNSRLIKVLFHETRIEICIAKVSLAGKNDLDWWCQSQQLRIYIFFTCNIQTYTNNSTTTVPVNSLEQYFQQETKDFRKSIYIYRNILLQTYKPAFFPRTQPTSKTYFLSTEVKYFLQISMVLLRCPISNKTRINLIIN